MKWYSDIGLTFDFRAVGLAGSCVVLAPSPPSNRTLSYTVNPAVLKSGKSILKVMNSIFDTCKNCHKHYDMLHKVIRKCR